MRRLVKSSIIALLFVEIVVAQGAAAQTFVLHRAVGVFGWFTGPKHVAGIDSDYAPAPYAAAKHALDATDIATLKRMGFDGFRLTVDPGPLLDADGARRAELLGQIGQAVRDLNKAGLAVIWDLHANPKGRWPNEAFLTGLGTPAFAQYDRLVEDVAHYLSGFDPHSVALEIVNEPNKRIVGLPEMLSALYRTARKAAPNLTIVIQGSCCDSLDGLLELDASMFGNDPNVLYSFHFYGPRGFPQQGQPNAPNFANLGMVPYPASARPESVPLAALQSNLDKADVDPGARSDLYMRGKTAIDRYYAMGADRAWIEAQFDRVSAWARSQNINPDRILLGEFGAVRAENGAGPAPDDRVRWLGDVRAIAEAHRFPWSVWNFRGDMSIMNGRESRDPDPAVARALGLNP